MENSNIFLSINGQKIGLDAFIKMANQKSKNEEKGEKDKENQIENNEEEKQDEEKDNKKSAENEEAKSSEESKSDNNDEDKDDDKKDKADNAKLFNSFEERIMASVRAEEKAKRQAYNEAVKVLGDFNAFGMSVKEIYTKALNSVNITPSGKESEVELASMLRVANSIKVDNSFNYNQSVDDKLEEIEMFI